MTTVKEFEQITQAQGLSQRQRAGIALHGFIIILMGFLGGMAWLVVLGDYLQFWPLPPVELSLPETKELWRNAHTGPITNGILALALVGISPILRMNLKTGRLLYYATLVMLWGNTIGYQTAPFTSNRGLNPSGGFMNAFTYFSFYIAVFAAFLVVVIGIMAAYRMMLNSPKS